MAIGIERNVVVTAQGLNTLTNSPLTKHEGAVFWHLAATLPVSGKTVSQVLLASELAISPVHASNAIKRLCVLGLLMRGPKVGLSFHYKLNPALLRVLS